MVCSCCAYDCIAMDIKSEAKITRDLVIKFYRFPQMAFILGPRFRSSLSSNRIQRWLLKPGTGRNPRGTFRVLLKPGTAGRNSELHDAYAHVACLPHRISVHKQLPGCSNYAVVNTYLPATSNFYTVVSQRSLKTVDQQLYVASMIL